MPQQPMEANENLSLSRPEGSQAKGQGQASANSPLSAVRQPPGLLLGSCLLPRGLSLQQFGGVLLTTASLLLPHHMDLCRNQLLIQI